MVSGEEKEEEFVEVEEGKGDINTIMTKKEQVEEYGSSLNTLANSYAHDTIKITGNYQDKYLITLIGSESTHSFIDEQVVKKIITIIN